jgi:hypothetical protein
MISIDVQVSNNKIGPALTKIKQQLRQFPTEAHAEFVSLTPRRSGNAQRNTRLVNNVIHADYAYAQRLDTGWSSQAPNGMTIPFGRWMKTKLKSIFGK